MKLLLVSALFAVLAGAITAVEWDDLKITFGISLPLVNRDVKPFASLPRTVSAATAAGYTKLDGNAACDNPVGFKGIQYINPNETLAFAILYDVTGYVAGLQFLAKYSEANPSTTVSNRYDLLPIFLNLTINGEAYFSISVYTVDPTTICSPGRTQQEFDSQGTGIGMWIQNGTEVIQVANNRDDALAQGWSDNNCGPKMGWHCWYQADTWQAANCDNLFPIFLLYNNDKELHGFGFSVLGHLSSKRYEQPPVAAIKFLAGSGTTMPAQCLIDKANTVGVSTMHAYFISTASSISCPVSSLAKGLWGTVTSYFG